MLAPVAIGYTLEVEVVLFTVKNIVAELEPVLLTSKDTTLPKTNASWVPYAVTDEPVVADNGYVPVVPVNPTPGVTKYGIWVKV